jgi:hypothetical protein
MTENNGWNEWSKYVLKELERLNIVIEKQSEQLQQIGEDIVSLKLKAGIWGLVGGAIPVAIGLLIKLLA